MRRVIYVGAGATAEFGLPTLAVPAKAGYFKFNNQGEFTDIGVLAEVGFRGTTVTLTSGAITGINTQTGKEMALKKTLKQMKKYLPLLFITLSIFNQANAQIKKAPEEPPPFVRFDCDAAEKLPKANQWAKDQWPVYYCNNVPGNKGYLGYWKTYRPGTVLLKVYVKGKLVENATMPSNPAGLKLVRDEAIKRGDKQIQKVKSIFEKYKSTPEYYLGLNELLSFSYNSYKDALEKEPDWDIKKAGADYNIDIAELLLKRVREKHDYQAADIVMYLAEQATKFKGEDKLAEYNQKLQSALKFNFSIKCRHTWPGPFATDEENYEYNRMIDTWNTEGIQDKISGKITVTDNEGRKTGPISYDINFAWELKRCDDEGLPLPLKKQKVEFIVGDFFGAPYLPKDPGDKGASVIPLGNLNASKSITYSRQVDAADGGKENYQITISVVHAPK
ncbi:MAG TPA: hypothetical protein VGP43_04385 [Chitinophagaceae bacterium]|nr:hypothetical protein [Chitinophagaceae bacterium]